MKRSLLLVVALAGVICLAGCLPGQGLDLWGAPWTGSKTASPAGNVAPEQVITYTIRYFNQGQMTLTNVRMRDAIPANTEYVPESTAWNGTAVSDVGGASRLATTYGLPLGNIGPGVRGFITFQVGVSAAAPSGTRITNTATLRCSMALPTSFSVTNTVR